MEHGADEDGERVRFLVHDNFRDVEILFAENTARPWTVVGATFAFTIPRTWQGHVDYRRRRLAVAPGRVFCNEPGEALCATPTSGSGAFDVIQVAPSAFEAQCQAEGMRTPPHFGSIVVEPRPSMARALAAMQVALTSGASLLELESCLAVLVHAALRDVVEPVPRPAGKRPASTAAERLRDMLESTEGSRVRLGDFARDNGLSQFQLLRSFKRRYGLPPHAYDVRLRAERARQLLRYGASVTHAAAACDFTDESHFARHFRRIWGMSPGHYARQCNGALSPRK